MVGTEPVWPPPSPPWIITASAPHDATFTACLGRPTLGMTTMSCSLRRAISSGLGASANEATFTPCSMSRSHRAGASAASARRFTPNGASVRSLTSTMACSSSGSVIVADARMPRPPALAVPLTRLGPETQPMPVWTIGWRTPVSSVSGVDSSWSITVRPSGRHLPLAEVGRVEQLPDQDQLAGGGLAGLGDVAVRVDLAPAGLADVLDGHARVDRDEAQGVLGPAEVEDAEVRDQPVHVVEPRRRRSGGLRPRAADAGDDVDLLDHDARGVLRHPVGRPVVDGVARGAAHAEELAVGLVPRADGGDVLVAVPVDLGGAHHHVPLAVGDHGLQHEPERHPALGDVGGLAERRGAAQDPGLAVGQHQLRVRGVLGQPGAQRGEQAHRAAHDLAVVGEAVRDRDGAVLGPGHVGHARLLLRFSLNAATAAW